VGWRMVKAHPLDGVGAGNFQVSSIHFLLQPGTIRFSIYIVDQPKVAHNIYLQVLAELGIVGLLPFLAILGICVSCAVRAASRFDEIGDRQGGALARGLLLAMVAMLASQFFGSELFLKELWLLLASGPAVLAIAEERSATAAQRASVGGAAPAPARARLDVPKAG
jgi:putative inorganic carbon (HCO3(-)) transporter